MREEANLQAKTKMALWAIVAMTLGPLVPYTL
jgi:hypothetical protein